MSTFYGPIPNTITVWKPALTPQIPLTNKQEDLRDDYINVRKRLDKAERKIRKYRDKYHSVSEDLKDLQRKIGKEPSLTDLMNMDKNWEIRYQDLKILERVTETPSIVYRGRWRFMDVAVKNLHNDSVINDKDLINLKKEIFMIKNIRRHTNIVSLLGICISPKLCIVSEYIEGGTLEKYIRSNTIDIRFIMNVSIGVISGLHHLHEQLIIHKDIACRNILLDICDCKVIPKINDFGLSKTLDSTIYVSNDALLPIAWSSPETIKKRIYSKSTDIYSFGVMVWEMLCNKYPYEGMDFMSISTNVCEGTTLEVPKSTPHGLKLLLKRCWDMDPSLRPTCADIHCWLENDIKY